MVIKNILPFSHSLLEQTIQPGDFVIDGTAGNGNDTLFLAKLVGKDGKVFAFDIQKEAIERTRKRLEMEKEIEQVTLFLSGHERMKQQIPKKYHGKIAAGIFNLGYLPRGDHSIVTKANSTIEAVKQLLEMLKPGGIIVLVVYHGHPEGKQEKDELLSFSKTIDQNKADVLLYTFLNRKNNPPFIIAIEKKN
ncbi:tRNA (mnm(5)s(2)U34)-methyltransferase [Fervidibacillus halotolerans]|uniref:Methyltransferase domain-containing protein n=1 Tax=Fervidibacillus halotolerans TaxID=2980027 RepID=A0A9E8RY18_9BACI|nr:class I SAM-dependent methyltransferase [Fervidibacillus halotolerans]WAA11774.1 methyltransferase domain-containing protein [Fervidibacillus halotolerans]